MAEIQERCCIHCLWVGQSAGDCPLCHKPAHLIKQSIRSMSEGMQITPPARFTDEMLKQLRAVVREELATAKKQQTAHTAEDEDAFLRHCLRNRLSLGYMSFAEYRAEIARLDKQKAEQVSDASTVVSLPDGLVSGTIFEDGKPTALGRQLIDETKQLLARDVRLSSGRIGF